MEFRFLGNGSEGEGDRLIPHPRFCPVHPNHSGYEGERIDPGQLLFSFREFALRLGGICSWIDREATVLAVRLLSTNPAAKRVYISAGIHGDEPAGPSALLAGLREARFSESIDWTLIPCLNPAGLRQNQRENADKIDLNRDYTRCASGLVRSHTRWLRSQPKYDLAISLHEDWESMGAYAYEILSAHKPPTPTLARLWLDDLEQSGLPVETAATIEGLPADRGLMSARFHHSLMEDWPEAFLLMAEKTDLAYTVETPSKWALDVRKTMFLRLFSLAEANLLGSHS